MKRFNVAKTYSILYVVETVRVKKYMRLIIVIIISWYFVHLYLLKLNPDQQKGVTESLAI